METYQVTNRPAGLKVGDKFSNSATLSNLPVGKWVGVEVVSVKGSEYKFRIVEEMYGSVTFYGPVSTWTPMPPIEAIIMWEDSSPFKRQ